MEKSDNSAPVQISSTSTVKLKFPLTRRHTMTAPYLVQGIRDMEFREDTEFAALSEAKNYCIRLRVEIQELLRILDAHDIAIEAAIWKNP